MVLMGCYKTPDGYVKGEISKASVMDKHMDSPYCVVCEVSFFRIKRDPVTEKVPKHKIDKFYPQEDIEHGDSKLLKKVINDQWHSY